MVLSKAVFIFSDNLQYIKYIFSFSKVLHRLSIVGFEAAETACQDTTNIWFEKMEKKHLELQFNIGESQGIAAANFAMSLSSCST